MILQKHEARKNGRVDGGERGGGEEARTTTRGNKKKKVAKIIRKDCKYVKVVLVSHRKENTEQ